jgi:hypothetical protein
MILSVAATCTQVLFLQLSCALGRVLSHISSQYGISFAESRFKYVSYVFMRHHFKLQNPQLKKLPL